MEIVRYFNLRKNIKARKCPDQLFNNFTSPGFAPTTKDNWILARWSTHNDNILLLGGNTGSVGIVDVDEIIEPDPEYRFNGGLVDHFHAHESLIVDLTEVPGSEDRIVTVSGDATVRLWDVHKKVSTLFMGHDKTVRSVSFAPDDQHVFVTCGRDGSILRWDTRVSARLMGSGRHREQAVPPVVQYSNAHCMDQGHVTTKSPSRRRVRRLNVEPTSVTSVVYVNDHTVVSGSQSAKSGLLVWDMRRPPSKGDAKPVSKFRLPSVDKGVTSMCMDRYKASIFAAVTDDVIYEFSLQTMNPKPVRTFTGGKIDSFYMQVAASPTSDHLMCGSLDGSALIWDLKDFHLYQDSVHHGWWDRSHRSTGILPRWKLGGHDGEVCSSGWSKNGNYIMTLDDTEFRLWNTRRTKLPLEERARYDRPGREYIEPFQPPPSVRFAVDMDTVSLVAPPSGRAYLSPTKAPSRGTKRKAPFTSPFKSPRTPMGKSPSNKLLRLHSPVLPSILSENTILLNSPLSSRHTPSKRIPRRMKNVFHSRYPTANLPNVRYQRHLLRLRQSEQADVPSEDASLPSVGAHSMEDWLRKPGKGGTPARLERVRMPSESEFGASVCSQMLSQCEREERSSPRKMVIRTPTRDLVRGEAQRSQTKAIASQLNTPGSKRKSVRNILDYFAKTPK